MLKEAEIDKIVCERLGMKNGKKPESKDWQEFVKNVIAPKKEARIFPEPYFLPLIHNFTLSCGRYVRRNPIIKIMTKSNNIIFMES